MKKAEYSYKDTRGALWVACSECERGANGSDENKCTCGWQVTHGSKLGCFIGTLLAGIEV